MADTPIQSEPELPASETTPDAPPAAGDVAPPDDAPAAAPEPTLEELSQGAMLDLADYLYHMTPGPSKAMEARDRFLQKVQQMTKLQTPEEPPAG